MIEICSPEIRFIEYFFFFFSVVFLWSHIIIVVLGKSVVHVRIVVRVELNVSDSLSLVVILMINSRVVLPGGGFGFSEFGDEGSESVVDELLFHVGIDIEISDWVDRLLGLDRVRGLSPVLLDTWNMPLVDDGDDFFSRAISVERVEDIDVLLVNENSLLVWSDLFEVLDEPVESLDVETFSVGFSTVGVEDGVVVEVLSEPELVLFLGIVDISEELEDVESGLALESLEGSFVDGESTQDDLGFSLLGLLDGEFHLQTRGEWVEVGRECFVPVDRP